MFDPTFLISIIVLIFMWQLMKQMERVSPLSHSYRRFSRTLDNNLWMILSFGLFMFLILPIILQFFSFIDARLGFNLATNFSYSITFNWIISILFFFIVLTNLLLISLITFYPQSRIAWLSYPIHVIKNIFFVFINWESTSKRIILLIFTISIILIGVFWIQFVIQALTNNNFSIPIIFSVYGFIPAAAIVLTLFGFIAMFIILLIIEIKDFGKILSDQSKLIKFHVLSDERPSTALEAIEIIRNFKSDSVKIQYVSALFNWIPLGNDPQVLIEEARQYDNIIADKLCQLAEIWEDSMRKRK